MVGGGTCMIEIYFYNWLIRCSLCCCHILVSSVCLGWFLELSLYFSSVAPIFMCLARILTHFVDIM